MRVAYLSLHPAPYRDEFLNRLAESNEFDADVLTLYPDVECHSYWKLKKPKYLAKALAKWTDPWWKVLFVMLHRLVFTSRYDFVLWPGYGLKSVICAILLCAVMRKKYGIMADSIRQNNTSFFVTRLKRFIVGHASLVFVPGEAGRQFYNVAFGIPINRIAIGAYSLDGNKLEQKIANLRREKTLICKRMSIPSGATIFLMVANMLANRHYPLLGKAFINFANKHHDCIFIMVGNGPDFTEMQRMAGDAPCLKVLPGCSFEDMLKLYAIADVYVHGGAEPASTALVIGAIAHLPLVSSFAVGCSADVIRDSQSGCLVKDFLSANDWEAAFDRILHLRENWATMGNLARELSKTIDVEAAIAGFINKVKSI